MLIAPIDPDPSGSAVPGTDSVRTSKPLLVQYLLLARRHLWLVIGIVTAALFAGLVLTLLATPQFTAASRIEVSRQQDNVTNVEGLRREEYGPSLEFYATQTQLLKSRALAERVVRRLRLARNEAFFAAHGVEPAGAEGAADANQALTRSQMESRQGSAAGLLLGNIGISQVRDSSLFDVSYSSANPALSAEIANAWVQEFIQQSMDRRLASTADARLYLEEQLSTLRRRLQQSEADLVNYAARQGIVRISEAETADGRTRTTETIASANVRALNTALAEATSERVRAEGLLRAAQARGSSPMQQTSIALDNMRARRADLSAELSRLLVRFEPEYPEARALREQLRELDANIAAEARRIQTDNRSTLQTAFEAAQQRETTLRAQVDGLLAALSTENRASIQYNIFQREVDTNRQLYDALLQRYKEIGVAGVGTNNIAVVDSATTPGSPSSPVLPRNLFIALVLGLVLASGLVFALEAIDEGIRDPQQVPDVFGVPLLGAIPWLSDEEDDFTSALNDPKSETAEAYMTVRTNLAFSTDHGVPRSLCIISTSPAEGKSSSSLALAHTLVRTGKKVVLVDADMRRPRLAERLGLDARQGLSNFLAGESELGALVQATQPNGLYFIAAGPIPPSASELLSGERLQTLVTQLLERFDHVIIDCPPMLGLSDGPLIARTVEGIVYVIEAERTTVRGAKASIERLRDARTRLFGVLVTKYRSKRGGYGYGYDYGYGSGQSDAPARA
jgi:polysaccharide biosynthesis transport protein